MPRKKRGLENNLSEELEQKESEALDSTTVDEKILHNDAEWLSQFINLPFESSALQAELDVTRDELKRTQEENRALKEKIKYLDNTNLAFELRVRELNADNRKAQDNFQKLHEQYLALNSVTIQEKKFSGVLQASLQEQKRKMDTFLALSISSQMMELVKMHMKTGIPLNDLITTMMDQIYLMLISDRAFILQNVPREHSEVLLNYQKNIIENAMGKLQDHVAHLIHDLSTFVGKTPALPNESDFSSSQQTPEGSPALVPQFLTHSPSAFKPSPLKEKKEKALIFKEHQVKKPKQGN